MRLRTQSEVIAELLRIDPECALTAHALRSMVLSGRVHTIQVGRKRLIDMDRLPEYLAAPAHQQEVAKVVIAKKVEH